MSSADIEKEKVGIQGKQNAGKIQMRQSEGYHNSLHRHECDWQWNDG